MYDIILNPAAGSGLGKKTAQIIKNEMDKRGFESIFHITEKKGDAAKIACSCAADKKNALICVGGDGSVQEIAGVLANTDITLGIIPAGSGNDFAASLYNSKNKDPLFFLDKIFKNETRYIDLLKCTVKGIPEPLYSANISSIGLDAEIVHKADDFKKIFGGYAYVVSTIYNAFKFKPYRIFFEAGDISYNGDLCLAAACNGTDYGGGFKIAPPAVMDDGLITLCIVKPLTKREILMLFPFVLFGRHIRLKEVEFYTAKSVTLDYDGYRKVNLDGNIFNFKGPINFEILPGALKVYS